ncbi:hypothetical protein GA0115255_117442 [Streptomyces sp. Ncost-T6T-2b]|nr:hypothetical protein GA0115255_117442 [Streptomyces sp. Ncost-T6T-2b]
MYEVPRSSASTARSWPLRLAAAFSAPWLLPPGSSLLTSMAYFFSNAAIISP